MVLLGLTTRCIKSTLFRCLNTKPFSTLVSYDELPISKFRTTQIDPSKQSVDHLAMFYTVEPEVHKHLFQHGGLEKNFKSNVQTFGELSLMVRPFALEIINYMEKANYSFPAIRYILHGQKGSGKSCTISHLLHYAYVKKMLILHATWGPTWTKWDIEREHVPSTANPDFADTPFAAAIWLKHFHSQNAQLLAELQLKTSQRYEWSIREVTEAGQPLISIVEHGLSRGKHATDCVAALLKEIKIQSKSGRFLTLVAVDGVNAFYHQTMLKKVDGSYYSPEQVVLIRSFLKLLNNDWTNAAVVVSVDGRAGPDSLAQFTTPLKLLGQKGFEIFEPFIPVQVENYSRKEIISCLDYYLDRNWLQNKMARTEMGKEELIFLSGSNPGELMTICNYR